MIAKVNTDFSPHDTQHGLSAEMLRIDRFGNSISVPFATVSRDLKLLPSVESGDQQTND